MLSLFKPNTEEIELLKQKIDELNAKLDAKDNKFQIFLNELHKEMLTTIEQHEVVNDQHDVLAVMVAGLSEEFDKVKDNTVESYGVSEDILSKGNGLISSFTTMVDISEDGRKSVDNVQELIDSLGQQSEKTSKSMHQLSERSKEIEQIVEVIKSVAEQTNLLAINASIESARAGEYGKGFAVVAEEVRKLAESTHQSTKNIAELTEKIQSEIRDAYQGNQININLVKDGFEKSTHTSEQMNLLLDYIQNVQREVQVLLESIKHQESSSEELIRSFTGTTNQFEDIKNAIINHIEEADVVSNHLLGIVSKVTTFSFDE